MYSQEDMIATGKHLAYILRHHPEAAGLTLDEHGWADVDDLISGVNGNSPFSLDMDKLGQIVANDSKGRYVFSDDRQLIRACQGHSVPVDVELEQACPPDTLWHGSSQRFADSIARDGLLPMGRLHVHLSLDVESARLVGERHGRPIVYEVDSGRMFRDGMSFYISENGVWLTDHVAPGYLKIVG